MGAMRIDQIIVGERRRQADLDDVESLAQSIREVGHLINPITVNQDGELIAGLNRLEACRLLGW